MMVKQKKGQAASSRLEAWALNATKHIGSTWSIAIHSFLFVAIFSLHFFGFTVNDILLILTTAVSLEAIYLSLFIQMTVNRHAESLVEVEEDIDEIQDDIEEISEDIEQIQVTEGEEDKSFDQIEGDLQKLLRDIETLRHLHVKENNGHRGSSSS